MRWHFPTLRLLALACLLSAARARTLYTDSFRHGLSHWIVELEKGGSVAARGGVLAIDVPAGCTVWFRPELTGPIEIRYQARMISEGGPDDRVSDLNAFWMASDARAAGDFFGVKRSGRFADYNQLRAYYVGQGGNSNTTTRFRRYVGDPVERPLLREYDRAAPLLEPNLWQEVRLVADGSRIQYYAAGRLVFDFHDPAPYTRGRFGFRTTFSHVELRGFRVVRPRAGR